MKSLFLMLGLSLGAAGAAPIPEAYAERVCAAIYEAEGGKKAKVPFGVLCGPVKDVAHARKVCLTTIRNTWGRWEAAGSPGDFIDFLGARYAPVGAANDPRGLNKNWPRNVRSLLRRSES